MNQEKPPEINLEKPKPSEVITEKGSVYKYLPDGRTQRFKVATGELLEPQDVLVFIPSWDIIKTQAEQLYPKKFKGIENQVQFEQILLDYAQTEGYTFRVIDSKGKELTNNAEVEAADRLFISFIDRKNPENSFTLPVVNEPRIGYLTADTRKYIGEDNKTYRDKHIGNKVKEIRYS